VSEAAGGAALTRPPEWYRDHPHARSSFSRLATHRRCPAWYRYQYLDWHRAWAPAVARAGQAVQEAFERIVDGEPAADVALDGLAERAANRAEYYFERIWAREAKAHEEDPNGRGPWDLPRSRYAGYLRRGIEWHVTEVAARLDGCHPRTGERLDLPPLESVRDAWVDVRPVHLPPGTSPVEGLEATPKGYFQGQCDLAYDWTGARRLADLKSSGGRSPFSTEIRTQLVAYAYLERELGRAAPEGLEAWFLGQDEPMLFLPPDDAEMDALDAEVRGLIVLSGHEQDYGSWDEADFPPEPAPVPGHEPAAGEPSAWCSFCPASVLCPRTEKRAPAPGEGAPFDRLPEQAPAGGVCVEGLVLGVGEPIEKNDRVRRRFTLANATGFRSFGWDGDDVQRLIEQGLGAGRTVRVTGLKPWKAPSGDVLLYPTPRSRLDVLAEDEPL
jgi:hypothetical protein